MHVYKHAQPALLYLVPACLGNTLSSLLLIIHLNLLFFRGSPLPGTGEGGHQVNVPVWGSSQPWGEEDQLKVFLPNVNFCHPQDPCFKTKCDNLSSYRDTLLPANLLSSVNMFFSPSHAEYIWYFWPTLPEADWTVSPWKRFCNAHRPTFPHHSLVLKHMITREVCTYTRIEWLAYLHKVASILNSYELEYWWWERATLKGLMI